MLDAQRIGGDGPAGLGLPPMVDHRHAQLRLGPEQRVGVAALAGEEQGAQRGEIVPADEGPFRVLLLDRAKGGGGGEQHRHLVLGDHSPEGARVRGANRLAFVDDGGVAVQQRRVADVAVAHDPAHVRGRPIDFARLDTVDVAHGPEQRGGVAAMVADDPLGLAGRARGVEDVERVGGLDRHAVDRMSGLDNFGPIQVAAGSQLGRHLRPLQDDGVPGLVRGSLDRAVEQRFVRDDLGTLDAARGRDDQDRLGVVDAGRELVGGKAAEHHRMDGADAGAGEHGDQRLGHHRHVDDDPVALGRRHGGPGRPRSRATRSCSWA